MYLVCCLLMVVGCRLFLDKLEKMIDMADRARRSRDNVIALVTRRKKTGHRSTVITAKKSSTR